MGWTQLIDVIGRCAVEGFGLGTFCSQRGAEDYNSLDLNRDGITDGITEHHGECGEYRELAISRLHSGISGRPYDFVRSSSARPLKPIPITDPTLVWHQRPSDEGFSVGDRVEVGGKQTYVRAVTLDVAQGTVSPSTYSIGYLPDAAIQVWVAADPFSSWVEWRPVPLADIHPHL